MKARLMEDLTNYFRADFEETCESEWRLRECETRHTVPYGEWKQPFCLLCSKFSDYNHNLSQEHKKRLNETARRDNMVGWALSVRRYSRHAGLPGRCTVAAMREFWGHSIDSRMVALLWSRLEKGAKFQVDMTPEWGRSRGKPQYKEFGIDQVKNITFAAVSYSGSGKYTEHDVSLPWHDLVAEEHDSAISSIDAWKGEDLHFERLIPDGHSKQPEQQDDCGYGKSVDGSRGWWPVCLVHWREEARDHGMEDELKYLHEQRLGLRPGYAICWYQLTDGRWALTIWRIVIHSRL